MPDLHSMVAALVEAEHKRQPPADDDTPDPNAPARPVSQTDEE